MIYCGDCLDVMQEIADNSVDMILCDLPYGVTQNKWDCIIPLSRLKELYLRILKPNGTICLHTNQPFTTSVISTFRDIWRYELVWIKERGSDFLNANRKPLKAHETIQVCYRGKAIFNKQMTLGKPYKKANNGNHKSSNWGNYKTGFHTDCPSGQRNPTTILKFNRERGLHPTQKPVALLEYLIRTYTNEGETVLDNCMGSGSTGVACLNTNRKFIGIEKDESYFNIAKKRLDDCQSAIQSLL